MTNTSNNITNDEQRLQLAQRRVKRKMGFYVHLLVFVLVNAGLWAINTYHGGTRWHGWPLAGWGLGLAIHGLVTFLSLNGDGLQARMVADEVERLKKAGR